MKPTRTLGWLVTFGLSLAACSTREGKSAARRVSPPDDASTAVGIIDVAANSQLSLSLRGGLGPIATGQTVTKAVIAIDDVELASEAGRAVALLDTPVRVDLLAFQNDLDQLAIFRPIDADRYNELRFRLRSAWIETVDDKHVTRVFASDEAELGSPRSVGRLDLQGIDPDGFVRVALPDGGIRVRGTTPLVVHFSLAESLSPQGSDAWTLDPRIWAVRGDTLSSLDVEYEASEDVVASLGRGYRVMLLDAGARPVSGADLVRATPTSARASFRFLESFQGPFVAVLLPPPGFALRSSVAVSVDVSLSVRAEARVHVTAVREIGREGDVVTVDVRADPAAAVIEKGAVTDRRTREVGWLEDVASETGPSAPVRPGQRAMPQATLPALPGLPPPSPRRTFGAMRSPLLGAE